MRWFGGEHAERGGVAGLGAPQLVRELERDLEIAALPRRGRADAARSGAGARGGGGAAARGGIE